MPHSYKNEQVPPKGYTKAQTVRAYQLDLQQRAMERAHLLKGVQDVEKGEINKLFADARKMTEAYRKFCKDNNRVAMIFRTQVTVEEQEYNQRRQHTVYNDVVDKSTGEILTHAGTHLDKVRLIYGDGTKERVKSPYYAQKLRGDPLQFRKMSGIIEQDGKNVDIVHWVQNARVDKVDEKDVTDRVKKKMKVKCVKIAKPYNEGCFTVGKVYEAEIDPTWYDFAVQCDDGEESLGGGFSREGFEFVSGTAEEKALWDYCEENGIDGL